MFMQSHPQDVHNLMNRHVYENDPMKYVTCEQALTHLQSQRHSPPDPRDLRPGTLMSQSVVARVGNSSGLLAQGWVPEKILLPGSSPPAHRLSLGEEVI